MTKIWGLGQKFRKKFFKTPKCLLWLLYLFKVFWNKTLKNKKVQKHLKTKMSLEKWTFVLRQIIYWRPAASLKSQSKKCFATNHFLNISRYYFSLFSPNSIKQTDILDFQFISNGPEKIFPNIGKSMDTSFSCVEKMGSFKKWFSFLGICMFPKIGFCLVLIKSKSSMRSRTWEWFVKGL